MPLINAEAGRRVPYTPDVTANLNATFRTGHVLGMQSRLRFDVQHVGESYSEFTEFAGLLPIVKQSSYTLANAQFVLWQDEWDWVFYVDNIFDEKAVIACCGIVGETTINRPRTIGLRATFRN